MYARKNTTNSKIILKKKLPKELAVETKSSPILLIYILVKYKSIVVELTKIKPMISNGQNKAQLLLFKERDCIEMINTQIEIM